MDDQLNPSNWTSKQVRENCSVDPECQSILRKAVVDQRLSASDHDNILRAAMIVAHKFGDGAITAPHLSVAIETWIEQQTPRKDAP